MAGSGRNAVVLGLMLLALCTVQRHKFHVSGASVRRSFASLVAPSLAASNVETDEPAESRDSDAHSITVASGNSALEQTKFIPVGGENLRPSENPTPEYADSGRVGVSRTPTDHCSNGESDGCRASVLRSLRVNVLVESLRLHRWGFWTASDADEADSDAAASDLDADADWNSMSSDEVDLFFPDEGEYEDSDGATGETVILQLQA